MMADFICALDLEQFAIGICSFTEDTRSVFLKVEMREQDELFRNMYPILKTFLGGFCKGYGGVVLLENKT